MPAALWYFAFTSYLVHSASSAEYIQLAFSNNPVYSGNSMTLTCSYSAPRYYLSQVEIEAFNGTLTAGYISFDVESVILEARGVLSGSSFNGYPNIPAEVRSVGLTLIVNTSFELDYVCTLHLNSDYFLPVRVIEDYYIDNKVLTSTKISLQVRVMPLPPVFTQNPLIFTDNDDAAIECASPFGRPASTITIAITSTSGQLAEATGSESASRTLPLPVTDWHKATAICTVTNHYMPNMTVSSTISINLLPLPPMFTHSPIVFNESENAPIECASRFGRPVAIVDITVTSLSGMVATSTGSESVLLILPLPLTDWHTATAKCSVRNHNLTSGVVSSGIFINPYSPCETPECKQNSTARILKAFGAQPRPTITPSSTDIKSIGVPSAVNTTESDAMLDCSIYVRSFPDVLYQWSVPPQSYVSNLSLLRSSRFSAQRGQTGLFNCTAKNVVTMKTSSVIFNLTSLRLFLADAVRSGESTCEQCWITAPLACRIVIFVIVFSIIFHRVCAMKRNSSQSTRISGESASFGVNSLDSGGAGHRLRKEPEAHHPANVLASLMNILSVSISRTSP